MAKMKNSNIRKYAERAVKGNRDYGTRDIITKVLKISYWVVAAAAIMTCLTMMIGNFVWMNEYKNATTSSEQAIYDEQKMYLITMIISVFALVSSYFLLRLKWSIPFAVVGCVDCVLIFTTFYSASVKNQFGTGAGTNFWIMAVPAILAAVIAVALGVMLFITYRLQVPREYDRLVDAIYRAHSKNGEVKISPEEFEKILDEYKGEELFPTDRPLKKSQRRRKEKQEAEMSEIKDTEDTEE